MMAYKSALLGLVVTLYVVLGCTYSVVVPLFESPDEVWHYEYVRWLVEGNGLPEPADVGHAPWHQEGSQPPLYYASAALLTAWISTDNAGQVIRYNPHAVIGEADAFANRNMMIHGEAETWPWQGVALAAHAVRFYSVVLGAVTVFITFSIVLTIFSHRLWTAAVAAALVAFNPQFLFLNAAINNDNLVTCLSAFGIWYGLGMVNKCYRSQTAPSVSSLIVFGLVAGLAALSKLSGLLLSAFVAITLATIAWRRGSLREFIWWGMISGGAMVAVSGWWFVRNWWLFGDPLALEAMFAILPRRPTPPTVAELLSRSEGVWRSVWAVFGWFNIVADDWLYHIYSALVLLGVAGYIAAPWLSRHPQFGGASDELPHRDRESERLQLWLLWIWVALVILSLLRWATMRYPQGRLLFPALSAAMVIVAIGLMNWVPFRLRRASSTVLIGVLCLMAAIAPWLWIVPIYATDLSTGSNFGDSAIAGGSIQFEDTVLFGDRIQLKSAQFSRGELEPGERLEIALKWTAKQTIDADYSVFVHLVDENEIIQAQSDSYPGRGNSPTSEWTPQADVLDHHAVDIPTTVPAPAKLKVNVGLYNFETGERLLVAGSDHWTVGFVGLSPPAGDGSLPNSTLVNFDNKIALVGYEFDRYVLAPGETLELTLWWEALDAPLRDIKVFTHLVLPPDATWAQQDSRPRNGSAKTDTWQIGQRIDDLYSLTLPVEAPPGVYFVEVGLYDGETYVRLPVNFSDKGIVLGQVRVINRE